MKTSFSKLSLLALPLAALTACQDYEPFDEATVKATMVAREYSANFINRYGEPDPNHIWGFEEMEALNFHSTRGTVNIEPNRPNVTDNNRNQWITYGMDIPGWPNLDGYYYDADQEANGYTFETSPAKQHPCGDVTDYEIQFVSNWFRTTHIDDPTKYREQLHLSEYFVMLVSSDGDRTSAWHEANDNISDWNNQDKGGFVTPVMGQNQPDFAMDHLMAKGLDGSWYHVNAFNKENSNHDPLNTTTDDRVIKYVKSAGSEDFAYHSSASTDELMFDNWILVKLEWDEVMHDGETHQRVGYYLAFDYEAEKKSENKEYAADGYYDNWIIKIAPAQFKPTENKNYVTRVMCEDLGNTLDYDFNDVVFDVSFQQQNDNTYDAIIYLRASGGTLPIYVGKNPATSGNSVYEAHTMFGQSISTPVNVGGASSSVVPNYRVKGLSAANAQLIDIYVVNGNETVCLSYNTQAENNKDNLGAYLGSNNNTIVRGTNNVPQRFAVPTTVQWMKECQFIEYGYPKFPDWVKNSTANETWYNTIGESGLIQDYVAQAGGGNGGNDGGNDGGNGTAGTSVDVSKKVYSHSSFFYIPLSSIGDEDSGKTYLVTFVIKNADIYNKGKIQRCNFGDYDINRDNASGSSIESRVQNDTSKKTFEFEVSSSFLNSEYQCVFLADGIYNVSENTTITCSVKELD